MALKSKKVFLEKDVLYAFINRADPRHQEAAAYFRYFAGEKFQVFTSYTVIEEVSALIYEKISPSLARDFLRGVSLSNLNILYPNESDLKASLKTLINYQSTELTFREAQTSVLANRNNIQQIATFGYLHQLFGLSAFNLPV
ncbi:MAG: hypothetical protein A3A51_00450 [Candidatus Levybacteria bacterium RIFCSPLOWO2_01_FULL_39_10]|nr:MAG: hypothetical protein A3A51_00450 [Candidatus Levybacteria bacterium RIFCSPLOWO2_01_FULL_39_10]